MPNLKDLTDFLSHLQTLKKSQSPDFPRFALSFSSKSKTYYIIDQILGFSLLPQNFSHKLASIEIIVRTNTDLSSDQLTFKIDGRPEKFVRLEDFRTHLIQYIDSLSQQDYTEKVAIRLCSTILPSFTLLILPDLQDEGFTSEEESLLKSETLKKKIVKKAFQDLTNLMVCVLDPQDNLSLSKPLDYLRRYDVHGTRSILAFVDSEVNSSQEDLRKLEIEKMLVEGEFPLKNGFLFLRKPQPRVDNGNNEINLEEGQPEGAVKEKKPEKVKEEGNNEKEREVLFSKLKDIAQSSMKNVFPGLLDELQVIQKDLQAKLEWLNEDGSRQGYDIKIEGVRPAMELGMQLRREFHDEAAFVISQERKEKVIGKMKSQNPETSLNKSMVGRNEDDKDSVRSLESVDSVERSQYDDSVLMEEIPYGVKIGEMFAGLYKSEANKKDIARFKILSDEEIKAIFQSSLTRSVNDFVKSHGFRTLVSSRLQWLLDCTCQVVWNIHEAVSASLMKLVDKHFIKLPVLKIALKQDLRELTQEARESTMQALMPVLNSHINYIYCKDPVKIFGDLYEIPQATKGARKASIKPEPSLAVLVQQLGEACRLYCQSIIEALRDCVPRMIGQLYTWDIMHNLGKKIDWRIENLGSQNPEALKSTDPYQPERDSLERKLMLVQKVKRFALHETSLKGVVWIEDLSMGNNQEGEKTCESENENGEESKKNGGQKDASTEASADKLELKITKSDMFPQFMLPSPINATLPSPLGGANIKRIKSFYSTDSECVNEDDFEILRGGIDGLGFKKVDAPVPLSEFDAASRRDSIDMTSQKDEELEGQEIQKTEVNNPVLPLLPPPLSSNVSEVSSEVKEENSAPSQICQHIGQNFKGLPIIEDYFSRTVKNHVKTLTQREWFNAIQDGSLNNVDKARLVTSAYYGIPKDIRGSAWVLIAKVKELKAKHVKGFYEQLSETPSNWEYVIEKDVKRTLVDEPFFKDSEYQGDVKLKRILRAYSHYDPDLGYTQGMNALAGVILMVLSGYSPNTKAARYKRISKSCERNAFWILVYIMKERGYRDFLSDSYPKLTENLVKFEEILLHKAPRVLGHLKKWGVSVESAFMHQFITVGGQHSPLALFIRVMDVFLVKGETVVMDLMLRSLLLCKREILAARDDKLFKFMKHDILYLAFSKCRGDINRLLVVES